MASTEQLAILQQGVEVWNQWRTENPKIKIDLTKANLCNAKLREVNLSGADLSGIDLSGAFLAEANFFDGTLADGILVGTNLVGSFLGFANLNGANLSEALIVDADLIDANLSGANLSGASLHHANLYQAKLCGANLTEAGLIGSKLLGADLTGANLTGANLRTATLIYSNFKEAILTGAYLYGTSRDDWIIDGVKCDFVYWDNNSFYGLSEEDIEKWDREHRAPQNRDFRPGEFDELYRYKKSINDILFCIGNLKGELFELVIDKLLHRIFPSTNIERNRILRKDGQQYEYDYIVTNLSQREIVIVEAKGYYQQKQIQLGDNKTKETVKWFFGRTFPFAKKVLPNPENYAIKACYITWANFTKDAERFLKDQNDTRLKSSSLDVFYNNEKLKSLLKNTGLHQEVKVLREHLSK